MSAYGLTREQSTELIVKTALEYGITDKRQIAYMLASAQHETDNFNTSREYGTTKTAINNGYSGGAEYYGRGYVQTTHDYNYAKMDRELGLNGKLVANPDLAATDPQLGAQLLVVGMARGLYTGVGIEKYVGGDKADYTNARRTVNGVDKADLIAGYAADWETKVPGIMEKVNAAGITSRPLPGGPLEDGDLKPKEKGIEVQNLQVALDKLGYKGPDNNPIGTDGKYGTRTEHAVSSFQSDHGIVPTGIADAATLKAIDTAANPRIDPSLSNSFGAPFQTNPVTPSTNGAGGSPEPPRTGATSTPGANATAPDNPAASQNGGSGPPAASQGSPASAQPSPAATPPGTPAATRSVTPMDAGDPRNPASPDHEMYKQVRSGVEKLDTQNGKPFDAASERTTMSLLALAKEKGFTQVDEVVPSARNGNTEAGERLFIVQGNRSDPAMVRADITAAEATKTPVEQSQQKLETLNQQTAQQQAPAQQEAVARGSEDPSRSMPMR
ncbi:peptidoglycan-binding domain-containing protein [Luteimonas aquatica]|uniref:peptidoglycan-binding domain-containing protein n=1 Tax=Luteimonas aquatica TaxID=450364 RepID=UPI001F57B6CF|nr:XVIPCD domain-containing protein [Luteimonas aquatica]